jgi:hypothetical protein
MTPFQYQGIAMTAIMAIPKISSSIDEGKTMPL